MSDGHITPGVGDSGGTAEVDWAALDAATERMRQASASARAAADDLAAAVTAAIAGGAPTALVAERARIDRETLDRIERTGRLY